MHLFSKIFTGIDEQFPFVAQSVFGGKRICASKQNFQREITAPQESAIPMDPCGDTSLSNNYRICAYNHVTVVNWDLYEPEF